MKKSGKKRLDLFLVESKKVESRQKAQAMIMAGQVQVNCQIILRKDFPVGNDDLIQISLGKKYVSRGGEKIESVIHSLGIDVSGKKVLDLGISTGGFSDYFLQHNASNVCGVDVNISQVSEKIRNDSRLTLIEKNVRFLKVEDLPFKPDLIVADLSFISIRKIIPFIKQFEEIVCLFLVKPQFEAEKGRVGKKGVIRDPNRLEEIVEKVSKMFQENNLQVMKMIPAGIKGKKGNQEFFYLLKYDKLKF